MLIVYFTNTRPSREIINLCKLVALLIMYINLYVPTSTCTMYIRHTTHFHSNMKSNYKSKLQMCTCIWRMGIQYFISYGNLFYYKNFQNEKYNYASINYNTTGLWDQSFNPILSRGITRPVDTSKCI